jgi:flagellar biosynthesis/type III secretory pathway ATPase
LAPELEARAVVDMVEELEDILELGGIMHPLDQGAEVAAEETPAMEKLLAQYI